MKKIICIFLIALNVFSLCSCEEKSQEPTEVNAKEEIEEISWERNYKKIT